MQNPDKGVVMYAYGSGSTTPSYAKFNGTAGTPVIVAASGTYRRSDTFYPGGTRNTTLTVQGNITSATFGIVLGLERQRFDGPNGTNSGTPWPWSPVSTIRTDAEIASGSIYSGGGPTVAPPLTLQTIKRTDLVGQLVDTSTSIAGGSGAVETLAVTLVTPDLFLAGAGASVILRACSGALASGDYVVVAADCG